MKVYGVELDDTGIRAVFYWGGIHIGPSPEAAVLYFRFCKTRDPKVTLESLVRHGKIRTLAAYNLLASLDLDKLKPIEESEYKSIAQSLVSHKLSPSEEGEMIKSFQYGLTHLTTRGFLDS